MNKIKKKNTKDILLWSGVSGILIAIGYFFITIGFALSGFPLPTNGLSWIAYLNGKVNLWQFIIWASIITNILYLIIVFGFLEFFKNINKFLIVLASIFFVLFVILELAGTWSLYPAIIELYQKYIISNSTSQQTIYISAIEYASTHFQTTVNAFYTIVLPSLATILYSYVMLKSRAFGKLIPIIGLISGICNTISVFGGLYFDPLKKLIIFGSFLSLFWFMGTGLKFISKSNNYK